MIDLFTVLALIQRQLPTGYRVHVVSMGDQPVIELLPSAGVMWASGETADLSEHADSALMALCDVAIEELMAIRDKVASKYNTFTDEEE